MNSIDCISDLCAAATFAGAAACQRASEADHKQPPIGSALKNEQWALEGVHIQHLKQKVSLSQLKSSTKLGQAERQGQAGQALMCPLKLGSHTAAPLCLQLIDSLN